MRSPYGRTAGLGARRRGCSRSAGTRWCCRAAGGRAARAASSTPTGTRRRTGSPRSRGSSQQPWFSGKVAHVRTELSRDRAVGGRDRPAAVAARDGGADLVSPGARLHLPGRLILARQHADLAGAAGRPASGRTRARLREQLGCASAMARGFATLPLSEADVAVTGARVPLLPGLARADGRRRLLGARGVRAPSRARSAVPVTMVTGWYDMFLPAQLADYQALRAAGRDVRLTIGPWKHTDPGRRRREPARRARLVRQARARRSTATARGARGSGSSSAASRGGSTLDEWPPPARSVRWHLHPGGVLHPRAPGPSAPDRYRYDPSDPTPSVGGSLLARSGGPRDNRALERRSDVLVYTQRCAGPRRRGDRPGHARELHVRSSLEHTDFFVRLCDVEPSGKSRNICDGLVRLTPRVAGGVGRTGHRGDRGAALAGCPCLSPRASHSRAGVQRRAPQVRAQSRRRRTARHRGDHARRRPGGLA